MVFKRWIAKRISEKFLKFYDKKIASKYSGGQQLVAMAGMVGVLYLPSLYSYFRETNKFFAPAEAKRFFEEKGYLDLVSKFREHIRESRKSGQRMLSYEDKMLIYSEFLNLIAPKMAEIFENKDLVLKNEF